MACPAALPIELISFTGKQQRKEELSEVVSVELRNTGTVRVFPNPVSNGELSLLLSDTTEEEVTVQLFNSAGQLLRSVQVNNLTTNLDVNGLVAGVYTLQIVSGDGIFVEKIVIEN